MITVPLGDRTVAKMLGKLGPCHCKYCKRGGPHHIDNRRQRAREKRSWRRELSA